MFQTITYAYANLDTGVTPTFGGSPPPLGSGSDMANFARSNKRLPCNVACAFAGVFETGSTLFGIGTVGVGVDSTLGFFTGAGFGS